MTISEKKALKFATIEWKLRFAQEGDEFEEEEEPDNEYVKYWKKDAPSMLATMIYDGLCQELTRYSIQKYIKEFGKNIWYEAGILIALRNHDT